MDMYFIGIDADDGTLTTAVSFGLSHNKTGYLVLAISRMHFLDLKDIYTIIYHVPIEFVERSHSRKFRAWNVAQGVKSNVIDAFANEYAHKYHYSSTKSDSEWYLSVRNEFDHFEKEDENK